MFLFRCCLRVDCGCQNESETDASRSSHSSHDYLRPYEKQIQCRLLPQPVDASSTKHFADYSGCSHTSTSRSLLVDSTQNVDYEEVLLVSVSPVKHTDEVIYAYVKDTVICKPPCSSGVVNDKFSPDSSTGNNNLLPPDTNDNVKLVQDSGSEASSDVSSASNGVDDNTAEVRYVADIRQFRPTLTSARPHSEECCCPACQSASDLLVHHTTGRKCLCKLCRDFHDRIQIADTNSCFTAAVGRDACNNQYRLISGTAQNGEDVPVMQSSKFRKIIEWATSDSHNIEPGCEDAPVSITHSDLASAAPPSEIIDDDNGLFSSNDELRYVFHKFINNSCLEEPFATSADSSLRPTVAPSTLVPLESDAVQENISVRSADDLEVAFFMAGSPSAALPDESCVTAPIPTSASVSTEHQTVQVEDISTSTAELTVSSFDVDAKPSAVCGHENLAAVENGSEQNAVNIVCSSVENDTPASAVETATGSGSPGELQNLSGALRIKDSEIETDIDVDSDLNDLDIENQHIYSESLSNEARRDVIVQKLSDSSSFFIELPAAGEDYSSDVSCCDVENVDASISAHTDDMAVAQECSPGEDDVIVGQCLEIVTPECIIEHPVLVGEVQSSLQNADDVNYEHDGQFTTEDVASFIRDVVANAVQKIADDTDSASVGICNVASENILSELPKQILIASAPLPYRWMALEDECDAETTDVEVFDTDVGQSCSSESICMVGIEAQDVPSVENYFISYAVHQSQLLLDDQADSAIDQTLIRLIPDDHDAIKLEDLVQPLEHITSDDEQDVDAGVAVSVVTFPPADVVEEFFMQYVLPIHNTGHTVETSTDAAEQYEDVADQPEVDWVAEDVAEAKQSENVAQSDVISTDATESDVDADAELAVLGVHELDWDQEDEKANKLTTTAETILDVVIRDAVAETDAARHLASTADVTSVPAAADDNTGLVVPARSGCLLLSSSDPHRKKSVHFADTHGLQLATVQHYHQSPEPDGAPTSLEEFLSKLSAAAAERRAKWTEHHPSRIGSWMCNSSVYLLACFELPGSQQELLERVQRCRVALESCSFDDLALAICGVVRVANVAFHKTILVRYTVDHWATQADVDGEYIPRSNDGTTDRFSFTIILPSRKQFAIGSEAEFAICYMAGDGPSFEFWDNNRGRNYIVRCCSKAASNVDADDNVNVDKVCDDNDVGE